MFSIIISYHITIVFFFKTSPKTFTICSKDRFIIKYSKPMILENKRQTATSDFYRMNNAKNLWLLFDA